MEETNAPVNGASVTFFLPDTGPNAEFGADARVLAILTDSRGQAMAQGLIPNATAGKHEIRVVASYRWETATQ